MTQQNRFPEAIIAAKGTKANILRADLFAIAQGELAIAMDTNHFYIGDVNYIFRDLLNFIIPWIVTCNGEVMVHEGEVVWVT